MTLQCNIVQHSIRDAYYPIKTKTRFNLPFFVSMADVFYSKYVHPPQSSDGVNAPTDIFASVDFSYMEGVLPLPPPYWNLSSEWYQGAHPIFGTPATAEEALAKFAEQEQMILGTTRPNTVMPSERVAKLSLVPTDSPDFARIAAELEGNSGFHLYGLMRVEHPFQQKLFHVRREWISDIRPKDAKHPYVYERLYHVTKGDLERVLHESLQPTAANRDVGTFGPGIYFTSSPIKANDYSLLNKHPNTVRAMLRCSVVIGSAHIVAPNARDHTLRRPPITRDSVVGQITRAREVAVYDPTQVLITEVMFYLVDPAQEKIYAEVRAKGQHAQQYLNAMFATIRKRYAHDPVEAARRFGALTKFHSSFLKNAMVPEHFIIGAVQLSGYSPKTRLERRMMRAAFHGVHIVAS